MYRKSLGLTVFWHFRLAIQATALHLITAARARPARLTPSKNAGNFDDEDDWKCATADAAIALNTRPDDSADATARWAAAGSRA